MSTPAALPLKESRLREHLLVQQPQTIKFFYIHALTTVYASALYSLSKQALGGLIRVPRALLAPALSKEQQQVLKAARQLHALKPVHIYLVISDSQVLACAQEELVRLSFYGVIDNLRPNDSTSGTQRLEDFSFACSEWCRQYKDSLGITSIDDKDLASVQLVLVPDNRMPALSFFEGLVESHRTQIDLLSKHTYLRPVVEFWIDTDLMVDKNSDVFKFLDLRNIATVGGVGVQYIALRAAPFKGVTTRSRLEKMRMRGAFCFRIFNWFTWKLLLAVATLYFVARMFR